MHGGDHVQCTGTQGPTHWYTHQENKYWWKGQGELYLHKQAGESRPPQMKQRDTVYPKHLIYFFKIPQYHDVAICHRLWHWCMSHEHTETSKMGEIIHFYEDYCRPCFSLCETSNDLFTEQVSYCLTHRSLPIHSQCHCTVCTHYLLLHL